jgi:pimeloyl-ACP methyl ester carboxylesterase
MTASTSYPIVLAHGIARFDALLDLFESELTHLVGEDRVDGVLRFLDTFGLRLREDSLEYFKGVSSSLEHSGFKVFSPRVSFAAGVNTRSADLGKQVQDIIDAGHEKVHIIAHSMGGLDARHMIVDLGMADRVASLTTIAAPHLGSSFADWLVQNGASELRDAVAGILDLGGIADLTTTACRQYNDDPRVVQAEATNRVFYQTYRSHEDFTKIFAPLKPAWTIIHDSEHEDNDGLVSISSQAWQPLRDAGNGVIKRISQCEFPVPADHLNEVGWWDADQLLGEPLQVDVLDAKRNYEQSIRQVYLDIAQGLSDSMVP